MLKYDFIGLEFQCISGVANPVLTIKGSVTEEEYDFVVMADNKKIDFDLQKEDENFILTALLLRTQKNISRIKSKRTTRKIIKWISRQRRRQKL